MWISSAVPGTGPPVISAEKFLNLSHGASLEEVVAAGDGSAALDCLSDGGELGVCAHANETIQPAKNKTADIRLMSKFSPILNVNRWLRGGAPRTPLEYKNQASREHGFGLKN